jgi:glycosyltransferase involved in cell wall biosynthesis
MLTFNGANILERAVCSIRKQIYPRRLVETIIVDNGSVDNSVEISKRYSKNVSINKKQVYHVRAEAMRKAKGEFVYMILEQDMEFKSDNFLKKMVTPLIVNKSLVASFTREYPNKKQQWVTRFISHDPIQRDPLFEFLTPSIESTIKKRYRDYDLCVFSKKKLPPVTHMLFRVEYLKKAGVWEQEKDYDLDTVIKLIDAGYNKFAYVKDAGDFHYHANNLKQLVHKRIRNLNNHFFPELNTLKYTWIDVSKKIDILKLIFWIVYANLLVPATIRGIVRAIKNRDIVLLAEPLITVCTTDAIIFRFMTDRKGRALIGRWVKSLF